MSDNVSPNSDVPVGLYSNNDPPEDINAEETCYDDIPGSSATWVDDTYADVKDHDSDETNGVANGIYMDADAVEKPSGYSNNDGGLPNTISENSESTMRTHGVLESELDSDKERSRDPSGGSEYALSLRIFHSVVLIIAIINLGMNIAQFILPAMESDSSETGSAVNSEEACPTTFANITTHELGLIVGKDSNALCDQAAEGHLIYDDASAKLLVCSGSEWTAVGVVNEGDL